MEFRAILDAVRELAPATAQAKDELAKLRKEVAEVEGEVGKLKQSGAPVAAHSSALARDARAAAKAEKEAAKKALSDLAIQTNKGSFTRAGRSSVAGAESPWAAAAKEQRKAARGAGASASAPAAESTPQKDEDDKDDKEKKGGSVSKDIKYLLKKAGIGKAAQSAKLSAAGLKLTELALGLKGMAQLQALQVRAAFNFRQLFKGIDPAPVVRAADKLFQVVNKQTEAGKALAAMFESIFKSAFKGVEAAAPYVRSFVEDLIIGAMDIEIAWLRLRLAVKPITDALLDLAGPLEEIIGPIDGMNNGLETTEGDFVEIAALAKVAADGIREFSAILKDVNKGGTKQLLNNAKRNLGLESEDEYERNRRANVEGKTWAPKGGDTDFKAVGAGNWTSKNAAAGTAATGKAVGAAFGEGVAAGALSTIDAVTTAGGALALALDSGVREKGKIHSPSGLTRDTARNFPAGMVEGIGDGTPSVEAAGRAMVPSFSGGRAGARGAGATITIVHQWPSGVGAARRRDIEEASEAGSMRGIAMALGVSVELS